MEITGGVLFAFAISLGFIFLLFKEDV